MGVLVEWRKTQVFSSTISAATGSGERASKRRIVTGCGRASLWTNFARWGSAWARSWRSARQSSERTTCEWRAREFPNLVIFPPPYCEQKWRKIFSLHDLSSCPHFTIFSPLYYNYYSYRHCIFSLVLQWLKKDIFPAWFIFMPWLRHLFTLCYNYCQGLSRVIPESYNNKGRKERHLGWDRDGGTLSNPTGFLGNSLIELIQVFSLPSCTHPRRCRRTGCLQSLPWTLAVGLKLAAFCSFFWNRRASNLGEK